MARRCRGSMSSILQLCCGPISAMVNARAQPGSGRSTWSVPINLLIFISVAGGSNLISSKRLINHWNQTDWMGWCGDKSAWLLVAKDGREVSADLDHSS